MTRTIIGQTINLQQGGNAHESQAYGWSAEEPHHIWSEGYESALHLVPPLGRNGYFIEVDWYPFLAFPSVDAQPLTVTANGREVFVGEVREDQIIAFRCPPLDEQDKRLILTFKHPKAGRPKDHTASQDYRLLALAFRRLRILSMEGEWPQLGDGRVSNVKLKATDMSGLAEEATEEAGCSVGDLLPHFEMIAGNCDMGLMQRSFDVDPLSLLKFAGASAAVGVRCLDDGFTAIGRELEVWEAYGEWMIRDRCGLNYHTGHRTSAIGPEEMLSKEQVKIGFLRRKLLEDLASGEKTFVADRAGTSLASVLPLFLALRRQGPHRMLWITLARDTQDGGEVREVMPGLFVGKLYQAAEPMYRYVSVKGWLEVLLNAWLLIKSGGQPV